ncbi:MAG: hypothetical protein IJW45_01765 [Oscillospiraceae bacterium]|nr:hypothetical protein [Oscillospiraceae bacterium]
MQSRTSLFNKTLLMKDITRFAPVWIIYTVLQLMSGVSDLSLFASDVQGYMAWTLTVEIGPMAILNMIYALIVASCLFGDLFRSRLCTAMHALPLRREQMLATHVVAGLLFSVVPHTAMCLVYMLRLGQLWFLALVWLMGMVAEYLFFFALATVCAVCTGSRFALTAVYLVVNFLSEIVQWFVVTFYEPMLPGLHIRSDGFDLFCPVVWMANATELVLFRNEEEDYFSLFGGYRYEGLGPQWWYPAVMVVVACGLLVLAVWLYRKRHLERAGDFVAFRPLVPVCSGVFTLTVAAVFRSFGLLTGSGVGTMIFGFLLGCFGTEMLLRRTVKVFDKKTVVRSAVIGGVFIASLVLTAIDPLGLTRWVPEPEQVVSVTIREDYYHDPDFEYDTVAVQTGDQNTIRELIEIHELLIGDHAEVDESYYGYSTKGQIHITYQLTDGRTVERRYFYYHDSDVGERIDAYYSTPEAILGYQDWDAYVKSVDRVYVSSWDGDWEFSGQEAEALLVAIRDDCQEGWIANGLEAKRTVTIITDTVTHIDIPSLCPRTHAWIEKHLEEEPSL